MRHQGNLGWHCPAILLALPGNLVGESQFKIPKLEPDTMLSNIVPLVSVDLEYHDEW